MSLLIGEILKNKDKISFHTPAHNNTLPSEFLHCDITELCYSDNLLNAKGSLKKLEQKVSSIYQVKKAFISTNGATNCILTAIYCLKDKGSFLIVGDHTHKSVYSALEVANCQAYFTSNLTKDNISKLPHDIKVIVLTTPNYYGECIDIDFYQDFAQKNNCYLVIDASHGCHFVFSSKLPRSVSYCGDLVVHSFHKTLPVPTGGAVLLCNNTQLVDECNRIRQLFHSTSPSYFVLVGIERAIDIMQKDGEILYDLIYNAILEFRKFDIGNFKCLVNHDFSRLVLYSDFDADIAMQQLFERGFALEMCDGNKLVAIVTPYNYKALKQLAKALKTISELKIAQNKNKIKKHIAEQDISKIIFNPQKELVDIDNALGRISANQVGIYPPGTSILRSGEVITQQTIKVIKENMDKAFGLENSKLSVILYDNGGGNK